MGSIDQPGGIGSDTMTRAAVLKARGYGEPAGDAPAANGAPEGRPCGICGKALPADARRTTKYHPGECAAAARRRSDAASKARRAAAGAKPPQPEAPPEPVPAVEPDAAPAAPAAGEATSPVEALAADIAAAAVARARELLGLAGE